MSEKWAGCNYVDATRAHDVFLDRRPYVMFWSERNSQTPLTATCLLHSSRVASVGRMRNGKVSMVSGMQQHISSHTVAFLQPIASPLTAGKGPKRAGYSGVAHSPTRPTRKRKALPDILQPAPKRGPCRNPRSLEDSARLPVEEDVETTQSRWWTVFLRVGTTYTGTTLISST